MAGQQEIAFALGGEAGRQVCSGLGMPIRGDTLIRAIRQSPDGAVSTPRVLGIDDWAKRKGQEYGTILVDLEAHQPVDVLDRRTVEAVAAWFKEHPGGDIVSRDRGSEYIKGVSEGAPEADQVADRWHLLSNLREALVAVLEKKPEALKAAAQVTPAEDAALVAHETRSDDGKPSSTADDSQEAGVSSAATQKTAELPLSPAQQAKTAGQERRQARFDQVHAA
jgi:transposase